MKELSRTGRVIVSCFGVAVVVAAAGVVWLGRELKDPGREARHDPDLVPARFGPAEAGNASSGADPAPEAGALSAADPLLIGRPDAAPGTQGGVPRSVTESLVLGQGETYYGKGEAFFKDSDFASASRYLRAEVESHPDRFYPAYLLGLSFWKEGHTGEAISILTTAASLDTGSVKARVNLGRVLNDSGLFEKALAAAEEAIALDENNSTSHNVRGRALLNLGRIDDAIEAFRIAVEKDAANGYAQNNLGYALIRAGRFDEAVPCLEEAVRLNPDVAYFQNNLGMAYERTAQIDKAKAAYAVAVKTGGADGAAGRNLARLGGELDAEIPTTDGGESSN